MKHAHVDELYTAYLEGTLPDTLRQQVEAHLRACPRCAAELEALRRLVDDIHAMPQQSPPANFAAGVRARLDARRQPRSFFAHGLIFAGGLAAVALALLFICLRLLPPARLQTHVAALPSRELAHAAPQHGTPNISTSSAQPAPPGMTTPVPAGMATGQERAALAPGKSEQHLTVTSSPLAHPENPVTLRKSGTLVPRVSPPPVAIANELRARTPEQAARSERQAAARPAPSHGNGFDPFAGGPRPTPAKPAYPPMLERRTSRRFADV